MPRPCTLLVRLNLSLLVLALACRSAASQDPPKCLVRGMLPAGSQIEFRSPDRLIVNP